MQTIVIQFKYCYLLESRETCKYANCKCKEFVLICAKFDVVKHKIMLYIFEESLVTQRKLTRIKLITIHTLL